MFSILCTSFVIFSGASWRQVTPVFKDSGANVKKPVTCQESRVYLLTAFMHAAQPELVLTRRRNISHLVQFITNQTRNSLVGCEGGKSPHALVTGSGLSVGSY